MNRTDALVAVLREPEFSHGEAMEILGASCGITTATLMTWYKRDLVPLPEHGNPGRGHRRQYSAQDLLTLHVMKIVMPAVGQAQCELVAHDCTWIAVKHYWATLPSAADTDGFPEVYLVISRRAQDFAVNPVAAGELSEWIRETSCADADLVQPEIRVFINLREVFVKLLARIAEVKEKRGK
ncbi:MAG TPA: MerR family transcriptional regulator [Bryobacteraceae bacterium]|nr:MerR family transcriptional regulator [Bryobacteraceae bacterium]